MRLDEINFVELIQLVKYDLFHQYEKHFIFFGF